MLDLPGETAGFQAMGAPLPVVHVYQTLQEQGGVETLLSIHRELDEAAGLAPQFRVLFERKPPPVDSRYHNWNFRRYHPLAIIRRDFGRVMARTGGAVAVHWPDGWTRPAGQSPVNPPTTPGLLYAGATTLFTLDFDPPGRGGVTLGDNWVVFNASASMSPNCGSTRNCPTSSLSFLRRASATVS